MFDSGDVFLCFKLIYRLLGGFIQKNIKPLQNYNKRLTKCIYDMYIVSLKKKQNVFPSIADSNRCTREFSLRRSTVHSNLKETQL